MPVDLSQGPIDPQKSIYQTMLANLQGNILKPHARDHAVHIFLKFTAHKDVVRPWMRAFAGSYVTSAQLQIKEARDFREHRIPGQLFGNLFLSTTGYKALGFTKTEIKNAFPVDQGHRPLVFNAGMAAHARSLNDPSPDTWDKAYRNQQIDAMLLLADDDEDFMLRRARTVLDSVAAVAKVLTVECGHVLRNDDDKPVEPFGYMDGISQPLFLQDKQATQPSRRPVWDPSAPLDLVLLPDPFVSQTPAGTDCFGSYLVFRKLEQNLKGFRTGIWELARALGCSNDMAKAFVLGRFKDGTPAVLFDTPGASQAAIDNFNYNQDRIGNKCPFHAHIRRLNPRGETGNEAAERWHRIARRSIPYGLPSETIPDTIPIDKLPEHGVGTLFMCFQRSLSNQFGFLQTVWANSVTKSDGSQLSIGLDPIMGQLATGQPVTGQPRWPVQWGKTPFKSFDFHGFVTLKGGEFLFAPSLPFFRLL
jgi:Dyp-type peroxidase family